MLTEVLSERTRRESTASLSREHAEARAVAFAGHRSPVGRDGIIPGLYGLKMGGWVEWHPEVEVRLARVDAFFGVTA